MKYHCQHNSMLRYVLVLFVLSICTLLISCDEKVTLELVDPEPPEETVVDPGER